jgi:hypothetical protein
MSKMGAQTLLKKINKHDLSVLTTHYGSLKKESFDLLKKSCLETLHGEQYFYKTELNLFSKKMENCVHLILRSDQSILDGKTLLKDLV